MPVDTEYRQWLTVYEWVDAGHWGICRNVRNQSADQEGRTLGQTDMHHILGARCELAFAKWRGVYYSGDRGRPDYGLPDVGGYQVRGIDRPSKKLRIKAKDRDHDPFVLVEQIGFLLFEMVGWIYGAEGRSSFDGYFARERTVR